MANTPKETFTLLLCFIGLPSINENHTLLSDNGQYY
jgi:hypothetical protein